MEEPALLAAIVVIVVRRHRLPLQTIGRPRPGRADGADGQRVDANGAGGGGGGDVFAKMSEWDNTLADGMISIPQELEAFGEKMPPRRSDAQLRRDRQEDSISEDDSDAEDRERQQQQLLDLVRDSAAREHADASADASAHSAAAAPNAPPAAPEPSADPPLRAQRSPNNPRPHADAPDPNLKRDTGSC